MNPATTTTPARILIVEDDPDTALWLETLLLDTRYQVIGSVGNGREAIRLAESTRPDLVVMDIVLPGDLDGIETAAILAERQDVPVLYLTGHGDEAFYERARATSPMAYLNKPCNERELHRAIELALDRHALMRRLKASEAHLAEAQAVAHVGSWHWHLGEDRLEVSDEFARLLGFAPGSFEPRFDAFSQRVCEADRPGLLQTLETLARGEAAGEIDLRLGCAANPERVLRLLGHTRFDAAGRACELLGTASDISAEWRAKREAAAYRDQLEAKVAERTAELSAANACLQAEIESRLRMEEALWRNEQRYRSLVDNLPEPILVMQDDQVVFANPALARLLDLPAATAALGMSVDDLVDADFRQACESCRQATLSGTAAGAPFVLMLRRADGGSVEVEALTFAFDYEGRPGVLVVMRDLSARRAMEQAAARFRVALDSSSDAVYLIDPVTMRFIDVNETACASLGYTREALLRLGPQDIKPQFDLPRLHQCFAEVLSGHPGAATLQTLHRRHDGSTFPVEVRLRPFESTGHTLIVAVARDISQRIRAEAELRETSERFQQMAENIDEAFWIRDLVENRCLYVNPAYERFYGQSVDSLYRNPGAFLDSVHPEDRDRVAAAYEEQRLLPVGVSLEYRVVLEDQVRWMWVRTFPIRDAEGKVYRTVGVARDMTERRESEEQYRTLILASMDGFWLADSQGRLRDCNEAACRISGYERDELLTMSVFELEASETREQTAEHIRRIIEGGSDRFETRHRHKNGQLVDIDLSVYYRPNAEGGSFFVFLRDITERKQAERALIESEARFATVFQAAPIGIGLTRLKDGYIVDFNAAMLDMLGCGRDEMLGRTTLELGIWPKPEQRAEVLERLSRHGRLYNQELRFQRTSGEIGDGLVSMEPIELNGEPHLVTLLVDISERKRIEVALQESEARYRSLIASLPGIAYRSAFDADWTMEIMSGEVEHLTGYPASDFLGRHRSCASLIHPEDRAWAERIVGEGVSEHHEYELEYRLVHRDGHIVIVHERGHGVYDGNNELQWLDGFIWDITARKQAEEALRNSEARFRLLFEHAPIGIAMADLEGRFIQVNRALCDMLDYSEAELVCKTFMEITHPDDVAANLDLFRQGQEGSIPSYQMIKRYLHRDGHLVWINLTSSLIRDQSGKPLYSFGIIENITERINAEQQRLAHEARQRDALVREVHHRIKNNLQGVIGLLRQHIAAHPDTQPSIEDAIAQINTIAVVHGLQSRVPQNELRLRELLHEVSAAVAALAMVTHTPPIDDALNGDVWLDSGASVSIALILNELIHNALKHGQHADGSGVELALSGDSRQATVRIVNPGGPLPQGFDLTTGKGCGIGLDLIRTLLPRRGCVLTIRDCYGCIETELLLGPPLTANSDLPA